MYIWKEIGILDIEMNRSDLDVDKMLRFGAILPNGKYHALEIEKGEKLVKVLVQLERGFEEYILFDRSDYDLIPEIRPETA